MSIRYGERERRARIGITGFDWVNDTTPHKMVLRNEKDLKAEEEERNNKKFAEIAARDAATAAQKYGGEANWQRIYSAPVEERQRLMKAITANPTLPAEQTQIAVTTAMGLEREAEEKRQMEDDDRINQLIDDANDRRRKARPEGYRHPLNEEIRKEWRLKSQIEKADGEGKYKTRPGLTWKEKAAARPAWKRALEWFGMTPTEQAAAEAEIENKMNLEDGLVGQTLAKQAEWDAIDPETLARMDTDGWEW